MTAVHLPTIRIGGPDRDGDSEFLRRERRRRTHHAARVGIPALARRRQARGSAVSPALFRRLLTRRSEGMTAALATAAFNSP
jgi:hypothetical protein